MSQSELARQLKTDRAVVGRWLKGTKITSKRHLKALPRILGTPSDYFASPRRGDRLDQLEADVAAIRIELRELRNEMKRRDQNPLPRAAGKRLRELAPKRGAGALVDLQYRMMQLTSILESVDVAAFDLSDADEVAEFHNDLIELQLWMDRSISLASARLDDAALERKIRKLRDSAGRTEAEQRNAAALAEKLERRRRESGLVS